MVAFAAFVIIIAGMRVAEPILVPLLVAIVIAVICAPPLFWLQRKGVPKGLSVLILLTGIIVIALVMSVLVGTSLNSFTQALPEYEVQLQNKVEAFDTWLKKNTGIKVMDQVLLEHINAGAAMKFAASLLTRLGKVFTNIFIILLVATFILLEAASLPAKLRAVSNNPEVSLSSFEKFIRNINRYMAIKTLISLLTGILIAIFLAIIGVDFYILWGMLAFMLNYIPTFGAIIAAVPAVLLALVQIGSGHALYTLTGYVVINFALGSIIEPRYMGRGLGMSTLVVFLSLIFWGWVFGPVGMLLSVPLTMTLKIALDSSEDTRWISFLLGSAGSVEDVQVSVSEEVKEEQSVREPFEKTSGGNSKT
jgi:predicted PurR-regulated permease PerM